MYMGLSGIFIGIVLIVLVAALTLLTNPPSAWVGRNDREKPKKNQSA
jgi:hypothetical protein